MSVVNGFWPESSSFAIHTTMIPMPSYHDASLVS